MVGASKILTVSYGTFSCTLEGFEEPFNTMKAIAEYFRDLAADDRYFGAEPPTPDAEMLHRIAEREIQRRVEAKIGENGVVLRAEEPQAVPAAASVPARTAEIPGVAAHAAEPAYYEERVLAPATEEPAPASDQIFAAPATGEADHDSSDVTAKLSRIRAVIAAAQAAKAVQPEPVESVFEEDAALPAAEFAAFEDDTAETDFEASAGVDDDFGFELELDDLPTARAADADTAEPVDAPEATDEAADLTDALAKPEDKVLAATDEVAPEVDAIADEIAATEADAVAEDISEPVDTAEAMIAETTAQEEELEEEYAAVDAEEEDAETEAEIADDIVADAAAGEDEDAILEPAAEAGDDAEEALVDEDDDLGDDDYEALAIATVMGAVGAADAGDDASADAEEDTGVDEDAALDALDLSGWRVEDIAEEEDDDLDDAGSDEDEDDVEAAADWDEFDDEDDLVEDTAEADDEDDDDDDDDDEDRMEDFDDEDDLVEDVAEADDEDGTVAEDEAAHREPGFLERARARVIKIRRRALEPDAELDDEDIEDTAEIGQADAEPEAAAADTGDVEPSEDEVQHAAVFAALTDEAEDADAFDDAPEAAAAENDDAALLAGIGAALGDTGLDAEAEDDLMRELADAARDARRDAHEGRAILEGQAGDGEASVERLMEEAKSKLEGAETRRRFSAISHLKAAVAATVADRKLKSDGMAGGETAGPVEEIERYRDDLSKAVRPRRPTSEGAPATRRPTMDDRPAPLMLVSEQRVDAEGDDTRTAAVIRPRRIAADQRTLEEPEQDEAQQDAPLSPEEAKSFAEFAERLGATNLAELLEAAAVYTATVEGLPHFSRPHLLRKVAILGEEEDFSREDSLRSFGMLLRQGKIQKISRGQFAITESSRFMSEARRAAR